MFNLTNERAHLLALKTLYLSKWSSISSTNLANGFSMLKQLSFLIEYSANPFHNFEYFSCFRSPTAITARRALLKLTFILRRSFKNPIVFFGFFTPFYNPARTVEKIIISFSRPWNPSTVWTSTPHFSV